MNFSIFDKIFTIMQEASFRGLINIIFWFFVIYYAIKFLSKLLLPVLAKKVVEKANQQFEKQYQQHQNNQSGQNQNHEKEAPKKKEVVGEYVDFEEID
jgi:hypothetical protein